MKKLWSWPSGGQERLSGNSFGHWLTSSLQRPYSSYSTACRWWSQPAYVGGKVWTNIFSIRGRKTERQTLRYRRWIRIIRITTMGKSPLRDIITLHSLLLISWRRNIPRLLLIHTLLLTRISTLRRIQVQLIWLLKC
jgi:hypothetical protein